MKKSTRVSLLVFTLVAAVFAFGALWYTRPGAPSYVIDEAKERQGIPLLEVQKTATQQPPVDIDYDEIVEKIMPEIKKSILEDNDIQTSLSNSLDQKVANVVDDYFNKTMMPVIDSNIDNKFGTFDDALSATNSEVANLNDKVKQLDATLKDNYDSLETKINSAISSNKVYFENLISENRKYFESKITVTSQPSNEKVDIGEYIPQIVDSIIPEVTEKVYQAIEADKSNIVSSAVQSATDGSLTEQDAIRLYETYRDQIIADLVPIILDQIEGSYSVNQATMDNSPKVDDIDALVQPKAPETPVIVAPTVQSEPVVQSAPVVDQSEPVVQDTQASTEVAKEEIKIPSFNTSEPVKVITPEEYDAQRQSLRDDAINSVLNKLNTK